MNKSIKKKLMVKRYTCISFIANNKDYDAYLKLQTISTELSEIVLKRKDYYYKLIDKLNLNNPHQRQIILVDTENSI